MTALSRRVRAPRTRPPAGPPGGPAAAGVSAPRRPGPAGRRAAARPHVPPGMGRLLAALALLAGALAGTAPLAAQDTTLARQSVIRRTAYGVPHILADNLKAAGYAMGSAQLEDYGARVPVFLLHVRGELARYFGRDSLESDFRNRPNWLRATGLYHRLDADTRDVYDGFARGVNAYIRLHPADFPAWMPSDFSGIDALATDMELPAAYALGEVLRRLGAPAPLVGAAAGAHGAEGNPDDGSNSWALAPSRTRSGKAILLRNPHLDWDAGYYEAQLTVPGVVDFYGDFRIGGPFQTIGGFNARLGWSTTNNDPDLDEVYALTADPVRPDHVLFDGASIPLRRQEVTVTYRNGAALASETREAWSSPLGPVVYRAGGKVYVWRSAGRGEWRIGEMWLRMMRARDLAQWKDALRLLAKPSSNFTYADADGNVFYVWYGEVPELTEPTGGDTMAVPAATSAQVWTRLVPFDSLPQLLNPKGGYIHNENDPFHYTNLNAVFSPAAFPPYFPKPDLSLRSQLALQLIGGRQKLSLEDVVRLKHSMRMLLADRVKPDLLAAVRATSPTGDVAAAADLLARWDNTVAPDSRGAVLFETWWDRYDRTAPPAPPGANPDTVLVRRPWTPADPTGTPVGLADPVRADSAFVWAVAETRRRYGAWDVAWGDVHRVRVGDVDVPVGGCSGSLGCFRVLWYETAPDGKRVAAGGDGWVLAVEFDTPPRAYSVLAYGESPRPGSPHHADQAAMFARGQLKVVAFAEQDVERQTVRRYHPGLEPAPADAAGPAGH
jgi:acyl-homoserine-lactone acylase